MKKFNFRFTTVLDRRREEERQSLLTFSQKQRTYQHELSEKEKLFVELKNALIRRENLGSTPVSISDFQSEQSFIEGNKQRMIQADRRILRAQKELDRAHLRYVDTRKRIRMIETLKEKDQIDFKKEVKKRETKDLEDLMIMRYRLKEKLI